MRLLVKTVSSSEFKLMHVISWSDFYRAWVVEVTLRRNLHTPEYSFEIVGPDIESRSSDKTMLSSTGLIRSRCAQVKSHSAEASVL